MGYERAATAAAAPTTSFSDSFNRASSEHLGQDWVYPTAHNVPYAQPWATPNLYIGAITGGGNGLILGVHGLANPNYVRSIRAYAVPLMNAAVIGKSQYSRMTMTSAGGTPLNTYGGPTVCADWGVDNCYEMQIYNNTWSLAKWVFTTGTSPIGATGIIGSFPHTFELRAAVSGTSVVLTVIIDGVTVGSYTDSVAALLNGIPGFMFHATNTGTNHWKNFVGGIL